VADSLSAMLQSRPYRPARSFATAAAEIARNAGKQFDPVVVAAFITIAPQVRNMLVCLRGAPLPDDGGEGFALQRDGRCSVRKSAHSRP